MSFKEQFPILKDCTYLNTASSGILSSALMDWRRNHDLEFFNEGSGFRLNQAAFLQQIKEKVAEFFHSNAKNTFLVPNFSYAFNIFMEGLAGTQRFLLLKDDYPSINYAVECRGFTRDYVQVDEFLEESIYDKICKFKPTVFAFSIVQYTNGFKIDFDFLRRLKNDFPNMLIVADGTQFCGTEDFNFADSALDFLAASGYKWMLGGYGNGFAMVKDKLDSMLYVHPKEIPTPRESFLQSRNRLSFHFEPGHQDTLSFGSLYQSILLLEKIGMNIVEEKVDWISKTAMNFFANRGLLDDSVLKSGRYSSIFNLNISDGVYQKLLDKRIICLSRGYGTRVGFHFYNNEEDLSNLMAVLDQNG